METNNILNKMVWILQIDDIKKANTGDKVYLVANIKMNDAIEDVTLEISI